jgi:hypothetical protein
MKPVPAKVMRSKQTISMSSCRPPDCRCGGKAKDLSTLIRWYRASHPQLNEMLDYFRSLSLASAIKHGAGAIGPDGKMYSHQYRIGHATCNKAADKLLKEESRIAECDTFDDLYDLITQCTAMIEGFGELACYDTALRIGAKLKLMPSVVHLHAGTKEGADNWNLDLSKGYLRMDELDAEFEQFKMKPHEIENFFCNYKDELKVLRQRMQ